MSAIFAPPWLLQRRTNPIAKALRILGRRIKPSAKIYSRKRKWPSLSGRW